MSNVSDNQVFGITLGNSSSSIAWIDEAGRPEVITNTDGEVETPSYVYFETRDNIVVGSVAREMLCLEPERGVRLCLREVANVDNVFTTPWGDSYSMVQIAAFIVKKLVNDAEEATGNRVRKVVLSCPTWFGSAERRALKDSALYSGLDVVKVVDDTSAAVCAYTEQAHRCGQELPERVLIFDLGGSTLNVCVARTYSDSGSVEIVSSGGDAHLGGADWDAALGELLVSKWCEATETSRDVVCDTMNRQEVFQIAERVKKMLTVRTNAKTRLSLNGETVIRAEVTRDEFEAATASLLERAVQMTRQTLARAARKEDIENFQIDEIVCVGGGCLMPQISERLEREFEKPVRIFDPHICVGKGTVVLGNQPIATFSPVLEKSYGILVSRNREDGSVEDVVFNLLLRQQRLSTAWYSKNFRVQSDGFRKIQIKMVESDSGGWQNGLNVEEQNRLIPFRMILNPVIHSLEIFLPADVSRGEEITVTFHADQDGGVNVLALLQRTGESLVLRGDDKVRPARRDISGIEIE